eukprot:scaffold70798_cov27-Prasinocladus_malaysianus.AAC.1
MERLTIYTCVIATERWAITTSRYTHNGKHTNASNRTAVWVFYSHAPVDGHEGLGQLLADLKPLLGIVGLDARQDVLHALAGVEQLLAHLGQDGPVGGVPVLAGVEQGVHARLVVLRGLLHELVLVLEAEVVRVGRHDRLRLALSSNSLTKQQKSQLNKKKPAVFGSLVRLVRFITQCRHGEAKIVLRLHRHVS